MDHTTPSRSPHNALHSPSIRMPTLCAAASIMPYSQTDFLEVGKSFMQCSTAPARQLVFQTVFMTISVFIADILPNPQVLGSLGCL